MKAIVCDKCGKVVLIPDKEPAFGTKTGLYRLVSMNDGNVIVDLCEECKKELMDAVRRNVDEP